MYFGSAWDQERLLAHVRAQGTILRETDAVDQDRMGPVDRHTIVVQEPGGSRVLLVTRRYGRPSVRRASVACAPCNTAL